MSCSVEYEVTGAFRNSVRSASLRAAVSSGSSAGSTFPDAASGPARGGVQVHARCAHFVWAVRAGRAHRCAQLVLHAVLLAPGCLHLARCVLARSLCCPAPAETPLRRVGPCPATGTPPASVQVQHTPLSKLQGVSASTAAGFCAQSKACFRCSVPYRGAGFCLEVEPALHTLRAWQIIARIQRPRLHRVAIEDWLSRVWSSATPVDTLHTMLDARAQTLRPCSTRRSKLLVQIAAGARDTASQGRA